MIKGRKPKPSGVHVVNGNPGKKKRSRVEPNAPGEMPAPFEHLSEVVKAAWFQIGNILDQSRVITLAHGHALEQAAEELVEIRELRVEIAKHGRFQNIRMTNGSKKQVIRPAVLALSDAEKRFRAMMEQFGMTPSSVTRVKVRPEEDLETDPAGRYFRPRLVPPKNTNGF